MNIRNGNIKFPLSMKVHPFAQSFIMRTLEPNSAKRLSLEQMLDHPFLASADIPERLPITALMKQPHFGTKYELPTVTIQSPRPLG